MDSVKNFDVFVFIRYLRDVHKIFTNQEHLITIQTGFRYNKGRGKFIVNHLEYKQVLDPFTTNILGLESEDKGSNGISSCYLLTDSVDTCHKAETVSEAVVNILSVPAIGVLMRLSPVISLVDDYSFYIYHRAKASNI